MVLPLQPGHVPKSGSKGARPWRKAGAQTSMAILAPPAAPLVSLPLPRALAGRRTEDDARQISRWKGVVGDKGRWVRALVNKVIRRAACAPRCRVALCRPWALTATVPDAVQAGARTLRTYLLLYNRSNKRWDDATVSPVIRQTLLHW